MLNRLPRTLAGFALTAVFSIGSAHTASAQDNIWRIAKVSGEAWVASQGVQPASLSQAIVLRPGDAIRTGRNGRVLLVRGAETMLVSANSAISLPEAGRSGMSTVIQQAGSILLDVEKRNVQHFEVETPFLAAVVKGTRFRVTIEGGQARVAVERGQVQVSEFRSGQYALVMPGQTARASGASAQGLQLSGAGALGRVEQGAAQTPRVAPLAVPGGGLKPAAGSTPLSGAQATTGSDPTRGAKPSPGVNEASERRSTGAGVTRASNGSVRITAPLGEVKLDIGKVTRGLARSETGNGRASQAGQKATVWSTGELNPGNGGNKSNLGNTGSADPAPSAARSAAATAAVATTTTSTVGGAANASGAANAGSSQGQAQSAANQGNGNGGSGNGNAGGNGNGNDGDHDNGHGNDESHYDPSNPSDD